MWTCCVDQILGQNSPIPRNKGIGVRVELQNLDLFADTSRWPRKPYCSDDKTASSIRSLRSALQRSYIQANPPHLRVWSIYDVDRPGAVNAWHDANLPQPTWAAANRENAHAHLVWGLSVPVLVDSPDMRQKPLRYLCAVEEAFRTKMQADDSYSGLMTKNPGHEKWHVWRGPKQDYELGYLAEFVDLPKFLPKKKPAEIGLGRNVTLFEFLRQYAYRHVRQYKQDVGKFVEWQSHLNNKALERNGDFLTPMQGNEVWHVAKSVSKWTWNRFDLAASDARFSKLQAHRGKAGGVASGVSRLAASEDKRASARMMAASGASQRTIAAELGVSLGSVNAWLKG